MHKVYFLTTAQCDDKVLSDIHSVSANHCFSPSDLEEALRRSLEDDAQQTERRQRLIYNLSTFGLVIKTDIEGDGNCFFRAVCDAMDQSEEKHLELRRSVMKMVCNTPILQVSCLFLLCVVKG